MMLVRSEPLPLVVQPGARLLAPGFSLKAPALGAGVRRPVR
jgi:hypothetical protein